MGVCGCARVCMGVLWCGQVCAGVCRSAWVCVGVHGYVGVRGCTRVCVGVRRYAQVCACVWDEFSEFLPENRVPTSADFNTYPIRILPLTFKKRVVR